MKLFSIGFFVSVIFVSIAVLNAVPLALSEFWWYWPFWLLLGWWLVGGTVGYLILELDRFVDVYVANPDTKLAQEIRSRISSNQFVLAWKILLHNQKLQPKLTFRSALFQVVWVVLAFFTLTSTSSWFGKGFVLAMGLKLLLEQWQWYQKDREFLLRSLFWQINREFTTTQLRSYLLVMSGIMIWLFAMVV